MKLKDIFKKKAHHVRLSPNQVISMRGKKINIACISGALFVSWPKGQERILLPGDRISIGARGKICVMAFSPSAVHFQEEARLRLFALGHGGA